MIQKLHFSILFSICILVSCKEEDTITEADIISNLVLHFPFDNSFTERIEGISGVSNNVVFVADRKNKPNTAVYFNNADSAFINYGDIGSASFTNHIFTVSFWVKVQDTSTRIAVLSKRNVFGPFEYSIDNFFGYSGFKMDNWRADGGTTVLGFDPLNAEAKINLNEWQHIAFVCNVDELKVYSNAKLQSGIDIKREDQNFSDTDADFVVGNGGGYGRNYLFKGSIDDIKIYKRALSETDVKALYAE